jgi:hypothetical protein
MKRERGLTVSSLADLLSLQLQATLINVAREEEEEDAITNLAATLQHRKESSNPHFK